MRTRTPEWGPAAVAAFAVGFAASDEYHQTFVPGRGGRVTDVAIDTIGIAVVCLVATVISRRRTLKD